MVSAIDVQKVDAERQARMFEAMLESFFKRWSPDDKYDAVEFNRDLHMLVRQIYRDAQEPLFDQITKMASVMPMFQDLQIIPDGVATTKA